MTSLHENLAALPFRQGVGMMLLNHQNHVFVGQRFDAKVEAWQMPQGGVDEGETPEQAAMRELQEEVGTTKARIIARSARTHCYDLPAELIPQLWKGRYRGQEQHWFVMRFEGTDSDIRIDGEHPEFKAWAWVPMQELPALIVPFKQALYAALVEEFSPILAAA